MVEIRYFVSRRGHGSFLGDVDQAISQAQANGDSRNIARIQSLWLGHLQGQLKAKSEARLARYLKDRLWCVQEGWPVYRTAETPCLVYTAYTLEDGTSVILALAMVYRFGRAGLGGWIRTVLGPRIAEL